MFRVAVQLNFTSAQFFSLQTVSLLRIYLHINSIKTLMLSGGLNLKGLPEERAVMLAEYIIENNATVRCAAKAFGISKSTVHKDVTQRLKQISSALYRDCQAVLQTNKSQRHIRGGLATREKYALIKARTERLDALRKTRRI